MYVAKDSIWQRILKTFWFSGELNKAQSACEDSAAFEDHVDAGAADLNAGAERRDDHLGIWSPSRLLEVGLRPAPWRLATDALSNFKLSQCIRIP